MAFWQGDCEKRGAGTAMVRTFYEMLDEETAPGGISNGDTIVGRATVTTPPRLCFALRMARIPTACLALALLPPTPALAAAQVGEPRLQAACEAEVSANLGPWRLAPIPAEVAQFAQSRGVDPTTVRGDFDGDGRADIALFVRSGPDAPAAFSEILDHLHIAVCMNTGAGIRLSRIDRPFCIDGIDLIAKGTPYYDFEQRTKGVYERDGVHAYCFEKAGATYQFDDGAFRRIVDSD
jgi:hypothetical protein